MNTMLAIKAKEQDVTLTSVTSDTGRVKFGLTKAQAVEAVGLELGWKVRNEKGKLVPPKKGQVGYLTAEVRRSMINRLMAIDSRKMAQAKAASDVVENWTIESIAFSPARRDGRVFRTTREYLQIDPLEARLEAAQREIEQVNAEMAARQKVIEAEADKEEATGETIEGETAEANEG